MLFFNKKSMVIPLMICALLAVLCLGFAGCATSKITVTFSAAGGYFEIEGEPQSSYTVELNAGEKLDLSTLLLPQRESTNTKVYTFDGWSCDVSTEMTQDITIEAKWAEATRKYTVTFDANGGMYTHLATPVATVTNQYEYNATLSVPAAPTRAADSYNTYTFAGYDATVSSRVTQEVTYTAQWTSNPIAYTVTFNANGGMIDTITTQTEAYQQDNMRFGAKVELPTGYTMSVPEPTAAEVYVFDGWYDAMQGGNKVATVTGSTTVYAHWTTRARTYAVTFDAGAGVFKNGASTMVLSMAYGASIEYPYLASDRPTIAQTDTTIYTFAGFDIPSGATVTGDVTYTAQYSQTTRMYTVTFDAGDGYFSNSQEKTLTQKFAFGEVIVAPAVTPTRQPTVDKTFAFAGFDNLSATTRVTGEGMSFDAVYTESTRQYQVTLFAGEGAYFMDGAAPSSTRVMPLDYGANISESIAGLTPTKEPTVSDVYTFVGFAGLTPTATVTGEGISYTASYSSTIREYTITFDAGAGKFSDGSTQVTQSVKYDETPDVSLVATPERGADSYAEYPFSSWGVIRPAASDVTYTAIYGENVKSYEVNFVTAEGVAVYATTFKASKTNTPALTADQMVALNAAMQTESIALYDADGFAGYWDFRLYNSSTTLTVNGSNSVYKFGNGTSTNPYRIDNMASFGAMFVKLHAFYTAYTEAEDDVAKAVVLNTAQNVYYQMIADVDFADYSQGPVTSEWFIGHLDAQKSETENYSIYNIDPADFGATYGIIFEEIRNAYVSNLDIVEGEYLASLAYAARGDYVEFSNVNIRNAAGVEYTRLTSDDNNESAYLAHTMARRTVFQNCTNEANYYSEASYFGIFLGGYSKYENSAATLIFDHCVNKGQVTASASVAMLTGNPSYRAFEMDAITITDCVNNGNITGLQVGGFVGFSTTNAAGITAEIKQTLDALVTNGATGSINTLSTIAATLSTSPDFTLEAASELSAGEYVLTVVAFARNTTDLSTLRVNYSAAVIVPSTTTVVDFGLAHYDFIDRSAYEAYASAEAADALEWQTMTGYDIYYAFDDAQKYVVFDFSDSYDPNLILSRTTTSTAYITYYDSDGVMRAARTYSVAPCTRVANETELYAAISSKKSNIIISNDFEITTQNNTANAAFAVINYDLTLDFGGNTVTVSDAVTRAFVLDNAEMTVQNGTFETYNYAFRVQNGGVLNVNSDMSIHTGASGYAAIFVKEQGSTVNAYGTISCVDNSAIAGNGSTGQGGVIINVIGGTVSSTNEAAIYMPNTTTLNITDNSRVSGYSAIYVKSGRITIANSSFAATGAKQDYSYNGNGYNVTGDAIIIDSCAYPGGPADVTIGAGVTFSVAGEGCAQIAHYIKAGCTAEAGTVATISAQGYTVTTVDQNELASSQNAN